MLLTFCMFVSGVCSHGSVHAHLQLPQIKECEDEYPPQIDEVPVQAGDLHGLIAALAVIKSRPDPAGYDSQVNHARRDVQAVETGDHEERRTKLTHALAVPQRP